MTQLYAHDGRSDGAAGDAAHRWGESAYPSLWVGFTPAAREAGALATRFDIVLAAGS